MSKPANFMGLRRLLGKAEASSEGADTTAASDGADTVQGADGADTTDGDEGDDTLEGGDSTQAGSEGADSVAAADGDDAAAPAASVTTGTESADYRAGYEAAQRRWAGVLMSDAARGNLEMATDLLAESTMDADAIVGMCERHAGGNSAALQLLDRTPKPKVAGGAATTEASGQDGKQVRLSAAERVNSRLSAPKGVKTRRAAKAPAAVTA